MNPKTLSCTLLLLISLSQPLPVWSAGAGDFSTEHTQILNNLELLAIHGIDVEQLENMILNTLAAGGGAWTKTRQDLIDLHKAVQRGIAIAYSSSAWEQLFQTRYPGYQTFVGEQRYTKKYEAWISGTLDGIRGALAAANLQMEQLNDEEAIIDQLKSMSTSTVGRHQALMVGNMIRAESVQQVRKLRELIMAQMQMQSAFMSTQTQIEAEKAAITKKIFEHDPCKALSEKVRSHRQILLGKTVDCP